MCKLVVSGLALFFAGMFFESWVNMCKYDDLLISLPYTMAICTGFGVAILIAEMGDMGLAILKEKISAHLAMRREALDYLVKLKKREEVPNDWPSNL